MVKGRIFWLQVATGIVALLPLASLVWDYAQGNLTANPIQQIQLRTGNYALIFLVLTLCCTPISKLFHLDWVVRLRWILGLYAFLYATLHLLNFVWLDYGFDFDLMLLDVSGKRYVFIGLVAFLCLLILAVTSIKGLARRLGRNWQRLHWFIYLSAVLAVVHFFWQVKADIRRPLIYGILVAVLLILRIPYVSKALRKNPL